MIYTCKCEHEYQDKIYGKSHRVHNPCKSGSKARCTVCKNERSIGGDDSKTKPKK